MTTLAIDPQFPATIYAGTMADAVYKSPDGGQHWLPHNVGLKEHVSFINQFVFHPTDHEQIYAATTVGAFYTKDGGREWEERMAGMKEVHIVVSIAIHPRDPRILYAGTTGGIYRSDNAGMGWKKINNGLIPEQELMGAMALGVNAIVFDVVNPDIVYAGTTKGLFRTATRGEQWETNRAIAPRSLRQQYPPRPGPAEDPLYRRAGWSLEKPRQRTILEAINNGLASLNIRTLAMSQRDSASTLCRHQRERPLPLDRRRRELGAPATQGCADSKLACCHDNGFPRIILLATMFEPTAPSTDYTLALREEFRHHLETFYAQLKLAPPYESVEKAIRSLTTSVHALPPLERARLATDATARWQHFRQAFESSGLSKKHRGIIAGLARNRSSLTLPAEYDQFLSLYLS